MDSWDNYEAELKFLTEQVNAGRFISVPVCFPHYIWYDSQEVSFHFADEWYRCMCCGFLWEFIHPDFPAIGAIKGYENEIAQIMLGFSDSAPKELAEKIPYTQPLKGMVGTLALQMSKEMSLHLTKDMPASVTDNKLLAFALFWRAYDIIAFTQEANDKLLAADSITAEDLALYLAHRFPELDVTLASEVQRRIVVSGGSSSFVRTDEFFGATALEFAKLLWQ